MIAKTNPRNWKHLCHDEDADGYVFNLKNGDRFVFSPDDMARACGHIEQVREFREQFKEVFEVLDSWLEDHSNKIDRAYLSFNPDGIDLTVVQRSSQFDRGFDEALIELDVRIAKDENFNLIQLDVLSLPFCPDEATSSFVRPHGTMKKQFS